MSSRERTTPWHAREYAHVNGIPVVYTAWGEDLRVHLPGGRTLSPAAIRMLGFTFQEPQEIRGKNAALSGAGPKD